MLLLSISPSAVPFFLASVLALPLTFRSLSPAAVPYPYLSRSPSVLPSLEVSERTPNANRAIHSPGAPQSRSVDLVGVSVAANGAHPSSISVENIEEIDHDVDCFPTGARLPDANAEDCRFIINHIILGMKNPLRKQTWGFTNAADINLSLPQYRWSFKNCFMRVQNLDKMQTDTFRPVDVAETAQKIVQQCVIDTKQPLGGNADIGQLQIPLSFYIIVSGTHSTGEMLMNSTILSLPSDGPHALESRTALLSPEEDTLSIIPTEGLQDGEIYPIHCFDPATLHRLRPAAASDCRFIINEIILRLPNPMIEQTFGYTDVVDINLSIRDNGQWIYGQCVVFVKNLDTTSRDRFRFLDVAHTAHRVVEQCIEGSKYAIGGTADIGTIVDNFYVGVGGVGRADVGSGTIIGVASDSTVSSPSSTVPASSMRSRTESPSPSDYSGTVSSELGQRSSNILEQLAATNDFKPPVRCLRSGMPAARKIDIQDCTDAAMVILRNGKVLVPQTFTTESTGGIEMPFIQHNKSCYLMLDSESKLSISDSIPLLKIVYWALEIMLACISNREQGFGGLSYLDQNKGLFVSVTGVDVSVTGVDPTYVAKGLASLSDESPSATGLNIVPCRSSV